MIRAPRRGSQAVEFALVLPLLLTLLAGVVDLGQYLVVSEGLVSAVAEGARAGALAETGQSPTTIAQSVATTSWSTTSLPGSLTLQAATSGSAPDRMLTLSGEVTFDAWFGFLGLPTSIEYEHTLRLSEQ
jgi:Flp pilus assembly protein TadG